MTEQEEEYYELLQISAAASDLYWANLGALAGTLDRQLMEQLGI